MDASVVDPQPGLVPQAPRFKSRPGALAWSFRKSRDRWKARAMKLKAEHKRSANRVADVTKSRERWRARAEAAGERLATRDAELAALRARVAELELELEGEKKSSRPGRP